MKPFNLKDALNGQLCITRDGRKAQLIFDRRNLKSGLGEEIKFPITGYLQERDGRWPLETNNWLETGKYMTDGGESRLDLVGMWEEEQPEVTVSFPAPIIEAKEGQEVWYLGFNPDCDNTCCLKFQSKMNFHQYLLETGQLFATKEDCQSFLETLKGTRR